MNKYMNMKKSMLDAGFYTAEDIEKIIKLEKEFDDECKEIAVMCEEEGYPAHGSNYDLRCENARKYYDELIEEIDSSYE